MAQPLDRTAELMADEDITEVSFAVGKILVPTDGSATAVEATMVAVSLAKCLNAEIVALFVGPGHIEDPMEYQQIEQLEGVKHSTAGLAVAVKLGDKNGVNVTTISRDGAVGHEILRAAKETEAGMIVMGTEGRTGLKRFELGSVAGSVVKESHVPVLVVRHGSTEFCMVPRG
jgi:nucleotide-binding universal stress UspA family protein